jgi:glycosyltransferase 2 family protein
MSETEKKKHKGWKQWLMFSLRWGIAVAGVWYVVAHMSIRDQAWVILNHQTEIPQQVSLEYSVPENSPTFPVLHDGKVIDVPRSDVVNEPDPNIAMLVTPDGSKKVYVLGLNLTGDLNHTAKAADLLISDQPLKTATQAHWVTADQLPEYEVKIPHPRDQVGLKSMIHNARPLLLWLSVLVLPITFIFTSYRWHELLKALDIHIGIGRAFELNMVGCFYNSFMPGSTGGDLLKAYYASKQTPHRMRAVISVIVDRAVGLVALIMIGGVMASLQWEIPACKKVAIGSAAICACVVIGLLVFYNPTLHRISGLDFILRKLPMQKHVHSAVHAMHMYGKRPWLGFWSLIVTLPVHASVITSAMFAGMAFGLPLHWAYYWVCVPVIVLAGSIPISPQGAGVMEAFAILLTQRQGVTVSQAFALAMSIRIVQIVWNLTGGIFVLRGGFHAPTETETKELETDDEDDET